MYTVEVGSRVGFLTLKELVHWQGGTGRKYAGYACLCDCGTAVRVRSEDLRHGKQLYCSKHCEMRYPRTLAEWLDNTKANGKCMEWQGPVTNGYGRIQKEGVSIYAHREVLRLTTGEAPEVVMHQCDNPLCINPKHLISGTHLENFADMVSKQRHIHGVAHYRAKLTPAMVQRARRMREAGATQVAIATEFGVSRSTIAAVLAGKSWKEIS
jgi:hypothetical protein